MDFFKEKTTPNNHYFILLRLVFSYRFLGVGFVLLSICHALLEGLGVGLLVPLLQNLEGNETISTNNRIVNLLNAPFQDIPIDRRLQFIVMTMFVIVFVKNVFSYFFSLLDEWFRVKVMRDLRVKVYDQLLSVGYQFISEMRAGDFLSSFNNDIPRTGTAVRALLMQVSVCCMLAVYVVLMILLSWQLTLISVIALACLSGVLYLVVKKSQHLGEELTREQAHFSSVMLNGLLGMRLIRIFGQEDNEKKRFNNLALLVDRIYMHAARYQHLARPATEVMAFGLLAFFIVFSSQIFVDQREVLMPLLLTFLFVLFRLLPIVTQLNNNRAEIAKHFGAMDAVIKMLDRSDKPYIKSGRVPFNSVQKAISFDHVFFAYKPAEGCVIEDVSFDIPAGQITALVGGSGAGKSTIADLVARFYDPTQGYIRIDGVDLRDLDIKSWRSKIGFVSQDAFVFNTTIRENIAFGKPGANNEEVEIAARRANAYEFIEQLPEGFETLIGDQGVRLSGGQRQRLTIARALLKDPEILILDEATSALDTASERLVQNALDTLSVERTVLVIAHRLSTIASAHQIIVLEDGEVKEVGNQEELIKKQGAYWQYHKLQFLHAT